MKAIAAAASLLFVVSVADARADEFAIKLKDGKGSELAQTQCAACHSLDYIQMNSRFLNGAGWAGEVTKMISAFGADIDEADAKQIIEYLTQNYGQK
jgi:mono/diheme cytochrome c family protein